MNYVDEDLVNIFKDEAFISSSNIYLRNLNEINILLFQKISKASDINERCFKYEIAFRVKSMNKYEMALNCMDDFNINNYMMLDDLKYYFFPWSH